MQLNPAIHVRSDHACKRCHGRIRYITTRACVPCAIKAVQRARLRKTVGAEALKLLGDIK